MSGRTPSSHPLGGCRPVAEPLPQRASEQNEERAKTSVVDTVPPGPFFGEHLVRGPLRDAVGAGVNLFAKHLTRGLELSKRRVLIEEVGVGGHQVGQAGFHGGLGAALRRRIRRHTHVHGHRLMLGERHQ